MKKQLITICYLIVGFSVLGQNYSKEYVALKKTGDSLYKIKQYKNSALAYSAAIRAKSGEPAIDDQYGAASSWLRRCWCLNKIFLFFSKEHQQHEL